MSLFIGVDIGGTKIESALVDSNGSVHEIRRCATEANLGAEHVLAASVQIAALIFGTADEPVSGIGIGAGGQIDSERGVVVSATDVLPGWTGTDIVHAFAERFSLPVSVDNDVNALAHGEVMFGAAKGAKSALFLALGTGVGGAIVIDGKIHHGAHWSGGELGHLILDSGPDARTDTGGARGTLEAYCSGPGLLQTYLDMHGKSTAEITAEMIGGQAMAGRLDSVAAVRRTGEYLGIGLTSLANIFDPEIIVIGGGLARLGDILLGPARETLRERALPGPSQCPVALSSLGEHASVIGAASLAMRKENAK